jgi:hypothetical protein
MLPALSFSSFYSGFWIRQPVGNNAFSFDKRSFKEIYVPPLIAGRLEDLKAGHLPAFIEVQDGKEIVCPGLAAFLYYPLNGKQIFIFDNHNHAFFLWCAAMLDGVLSRGGTLFHVDQHKDTRMPPAWLKEPWTLEEIFSYTHEVLNVGSFISPAQKLGIFKEVVQAGEMDAFKQDLPQGACLDIDLDIFAPIMDHIPFDFKLSALRRWASRASFITVATSPFFMDQSRAIAIVKQIFS